MRRPSFPAELFLHLAATSPTRELAWDCAIGLGETALCLTHFFERVLASDASAERIRRAAPHERISYRAERAEETAITPGSVDLITVAQALHWLELAAFYRQARRVLKPGGILAAWCYDLAGGRPGLWALLRDGRPLLGTRIPPRPAGLPHASLSANIV